MICDAAQLLEDAAANGFLMLDQTQGAAVELQLLRETTSSGDAAALLLEGCSNRFVCVAQDGRQSVASELQLMCDRQ